jgi:hypothetical protein
MLFFSLTFAHQGRCTCREGVDALRQMLKHMILVGFAAILAEFIFTLDAGNGHLETDDTTD